MHIVWRSSCRITQVADVLVGAAEAGGALPLSQRILDNPLPAMRARQGRRFQKPALLASLRIVAGSARNMLRQTRRSPVIDEHLTLEGSLPEHQSQTFAKQYNV
jgi:hypothetical protein